MRKAILWMVTSFALILVAGLVLVGCGQEPPPAPTPPLETATFRVEVSRNGFNRTPGDFPLTVKQGQEVEITFVYGDTDIPNNPHTVTIPSLAISTDIIDENNPQETLRFPAPRPGEILFMCGVPECNGHADLVGEKVVVESS